MEEFRKELREQKQKEDKTMYANVTAEISAKPSKHISIYSVAVTSVDELDTKDQIVDQIKATVNAKENKTNNMNRIKFKNE